MLPTAVAVSAGVTVPTPIFRVPVPKFVRPPFPVKAVPTVRVLVFERTVGEVTVTLGIKKVPIST